MTNNLSIDQVSTKPQIVIKRKFNASRTKVWHALTDKKALSTWLMDTTDFELIHGHRFQFSTTPRGKFDGIIKCEVLHIDEPDSLTYSWKANEMKQPTIVKWTLTSLDDVTTLIILEHYGFIGFNGWMTKAMLGAGWKRLLRKKLSNYLGL